jgi:hypothetical protein
VKRYKGKGVEEKDREVVFFADILNIFLLPLYIEAAVKRRLIKIPQLVENVQEIQYSKIDTEEMKKKLRMGIKYKGPAM